MDKAYEGMSGFGPGTDVLIETTQKTYVGEIISMSTMGVHLLETHRMETVGMPTDEDVNEWVDVFEDYKSWELMKYAVIAGNKLRTVLTSTRGELLRMCVEDLAQAKADMAKPDLVTLSRGVETFVFRKNIQDIRAVDDFGYEMALRQYDFKVPEDDQE